MRVLILGGNGFIGSEMVRASALHGHDVAALARDPGKAAQRMPAIRWLQADIAKLTAPADWLPLLQEIDAVVNCAGALQDGARDDVAAVQFVAMGALYEAASTSDIRLIVQISARTEGAETPFLTTKRQADDALQRSGIPFVLLRPGIVIGRNAYGGSALLRALAAFPLLTPLAHGDGRMQFAALSDVVAAVLDALDGKIATGSDISVTAPQILSLTEAVAIHRRWLGLPPTRAISIPAWVATLVAKGADLLGWLGWRSPLRSTALDVAAGGVAGHPANPDRPAKTLEEALQAAPAGAQDLWFARLYLLKPAIFGTLSLFWLLSGLIALLRFDASAAHLNAVGASAVLAAVLTVVTSLADIALGLGVVVRRTAALALKGMVALSLAYLFGATLLTPGLWADPLGPLVKVLPSIGLALVALAILDER